MKKCLFCLRREKQRFLNLPYLIPLYPQSGQADLPGWYLKNVLTNAKISGSKRLSSSAKIHLPEQRIEEMIKAGLQHLDLITYGREPQGTLAAKDRCLFTDRLGKLHR